MGNGRARLDPRREGNRCAHANLGFRREDGSHSLDYDGSASHFE